MTIKLSYLKLFGIIALAAGIFASLYSDTAVMILGVSAFKFLSAVGNTATGIGLLLARQNNQSSEQVGAIPAPESK